MESDKKPLIDQYTDLTKKSLVKIQYSCGGNSTGIEEEEYIPIVSNQFKPTFKIEYNEATIEDVVEIISLLKENALPTSDLTSGQRVFITAKIDNSIIGCVAIELYNNIGLLRSLAVNEKFRGLKIGKKLVAEAEQWAMKNELNQLYLLTTTAANFFPKIGWETIERTSVPANIVNSTEFSAICPSTAICQTKELK